MIPMETGQQITVRVERFDPTVDKAPYIAEYQVPYSWGMTITNALQYINANYDGGLAHYLSCKRAVCQHCLIKADGVVTEACCTQIQGDTLLEPVKRVNVIKDLLVK